MCSRPCQIAQFYHEILYSVHPRHCEAAESHACQKYALSDHIPLSLRRERNHKLKNPLCFMRKKNDGRGYDLDYYNLYLRRYLTEHHFPEAEDEILIAARAEAASNVYVESRLTGDEVFISSEKAMDCLLDGFEISPYELISGILADEFSDHISLDERSLDFWTNIFLQELQPEFKDIELSEEYLSTNEGVIFKLVLSGRIAEYFDEYGL